MAPVQSCGSSLLLITTDEASGPIWTDCVGAATSTVPNNVSGRTFVIDRGRSTTMNVVHYEVLG
jgi:hypothetical protein